MDIETKEMLQQILTEMSGMKNEMSGMKNEMSGMKNDMSGMKNDITGIKVKLDNVETRLDGVETKLDRVETVSTKTAIIQENEITTKINLILENQTEYNKNTERIDKLEKSNEVITTDVNALKFAFKEMNKSKSKPMTR